MSRPRLLHADDVGPVENLSWSVIELPKRAAPQSVSQHANRLVWRSAADEYVEGSGRKEKETKVKETSLAVREA